jgi:hypothetical protein
MFVRSEEGKNCSPRSQELRCSRARLQPVSDPGPNLILGYRPGHQSHVPGIHDEGFFIPAADEIRSGFSLRQRTNDIFAPGDVQERTTYVREAYPASAKLEVALDELVPLVEVPDPAPKSLAGEGYAIVYPLAHG